jgi:hypothetical protein
MAIRVEHQPSPYVVGLAAYNTGVGGAKQRQQKYAMDLFAQDRAIQQQNNRLKYMDALDVRNRQWQLDDNAAQATAQQQRDDIKYERDMAETNRKETNAWLKSRGESVTPIPDYATPEQKKELIKMQQAMRGLYSGDYDTGDGSDYEEAERIRQEYESKVGAMTPPSNAEMMNRDTTYYNPKTGSYEDTHVPGVNIPWSKSKGAPIEHGQTGQQNAQAAEAQKAQQKYESDMAKYEKERSKIEQDYIDNWKLQNPGKEIPGEKRLEFRQAADMMMEQLGTPKPTLQLPAPPSDAPAAPGAPATPAAPTPAPEIKLGPDGTPIMPDAPAPQPTGSQKMLMPELQKAIGGRSVPGYANPPEGANATPQAPEGMLFPGDPGYVTGALQKAGMGPIPIGPEETSQANASDADINAAISAAEKERMDQKVAQAKSSRDAALAQRKAMVQMRKAGFGTESVDGRPVVRSKREYDAMRAAGMLPVGTIYIGSDGQMRRVS